MIRRVTAKLRRLKGRLAVSPRAWMLGHVAVR